MGKKIVLLALLVCAQLAGHAQAYLNSLYKQANEMAKATLKEDYLSLMKYTHPSVVKAMGGEQKAAATLKEGMQKMKNGNLKFKNMTTGKATQCITTKNSIQCVVPQEVDVSFGTQAVHTAGHLFCISYDSGKKWYFFNANNTASVQKFLPEIDKKIVIPEAKVTYK